jgi:periplasmic protein TonB
MAIFVDARRDLPRWILSACLVVMAHGGVAAAFVHWRAVDDDPDPTAALVVNLAPMPMSPTDTPLPVPPGPEQVQAETTPQPTEKVEEKPEEIRKVSKVEQEQPDLAPAENPEVAMAALPPEAQPEEVKAADNQIPAPMTTAPQAPKTEDAVVAAAPEQGQVNISNSNTILTWSRQVSRLIERHKRYPATAEARNQHGTVQLEFSLDRQGRVTTSRIAKSSGSNALDEETLDLVRRAQPFPAPPPEKVGTVLSVDVRYNIHEQRRSN